MFDTAAQAQSFHITAGVELQRRGSLPTELDNLPQTPSGTSGRILLCHHCHPGISTAGLWSSSKPSSLQSLEPSSLSWETLGENLTSEFWAKTEKHKHEATYTFSLMQ